MTKEQFKQGIEAIKTQFRKDEEMANHLSQAFPNAWSSNLSPDNELLYSTIIDLLSEYDEETKDWLTYFIYELDFGRLNYRMKAYDKDKKEIPLSTADELWDFLSSKI